MGRAKRQGDAPSTQDRGEGSVHQNTGGETLDATVPRSKDRLLSIVIQELEERGSVYDKIELEMWVVQRIQKLAPRFQELKLKTVKKWAHEFRDGKLDSRYTWIRVSEDYEKRHRQEDDYDG